MKTELVRNHCQTLASKIAALRSNDIFCDVSVIVNGELFRCHRVVLSAASEYFQKMFNGTFNESTATEVTLPGVEASVFKEILQFMYTGDAEIHRSNVYDMICAADFYNLPVMVEHCIDLVNENLNALAEYILKLYSLAHRMGLVQLIELLRRHIFQNFSRFVKRPEFSELTMDSFIQVLNLIEDNQPIIVKDAFLEGIYIWITQQEGLTVEKRKSCLNQLVKKIDFLSVHYTRFLANMVRGESIDGDGDASHVVQRPVKSLHAYVSRAASHHNLTSIGTNIFTFFADTSGTEFEWVYSGKLGFYVAFMKIIAIEDQVYSLRFLETLEGYDYPNRSNDQLFCSGSSVSMYPSLTLRSPPCVLDDFDLCGAHNNIYVYNREDDLMVSDDTSYSSGFNREEITRGIYVYKRDIDLWLPVPGPKKRFNNACMTCDEDGVLYLNGGVNSHGYVQAYDSRVQKWFALRNTVGEYNGAACCASGKKIYVAGGVHPDVMACKMVEMYDSTSGKWQRLSDFPKSRESDHLLVNWYPEMGHPPKILSFHKRLKDEHILGLNPVLNDGWCKMPNLYAPTRKIDPSFAQPWALDVVTF